MDLFNLYLQHSLKTIFLCYPLDVRLLDVCSQSLMTKNKSKIFLNHNFKNKNSTARMIKTRGGRAREVIINIFQGVLINRNCRRSSWCFYSFTRCSMLQSAFIFTITDIDVIQRLLKVTVFIDGDIGVIGARPGAGCSSASIDDTFSYCNCVPIQFTLVQKLIRNFQPRVLAQVEYWKP